MTVATNALLERRGARVALLTTEGFRDVMEIARQNRPALYDLTHDRPPPLVPPRAALHAVTRAWDPRARSPPRRGSLNGAVGAVREADVEAVAVCLLFAFMHPEHEKRVGDPATALGDEVHVSLVQRGPAEFREYERFATTVADTYLTPSSPRTSQPGRQGDRRRGCRAVDHAVLRRRGAGRRRHLRRARAACSPGPAGGVVGAAYVGERPATTTSSPSTWAVPRPTSRP